jgi:glycosyltransferase involved in cell wall biosynthesis
MAIKKATTIFVPANTIKKAICKYYPDAQDKIITTYEGISNKFVKANQELTPEKLKKLGSKRAQMKPKQLICVGSLYPHKNVNLVIEALNDLPNFTLKIVGSRNIFQDQTRQFVKKMGVENQVTFAGYLSDTELIKEFDNSYALIQPSLSEGFGLTGVEAMACGLPVIASDIEIFREVYGENSNFFNPKNKNDFVEKINSMIQSTNKTYTTEEYNWDKMAQIILNQLLHKTHLLGL